MNQALSLLNNVSFHNQHPQLDDCREELLAGLQQHRKYVNPMYFYDKAGSLLFDRITRLPEYYPTRTEIKILQRFSKQIATHCKNHNILIEPGSGSCEKVRLLLDTIKPGIYVPMDISADTLRTAAFKLGREYPWLRVMAVCSDFNSGWEFEHILPQGKRVVFYPGSTIGNLEPDQAQVFLRRVKDIVGVGGGALVGVDLHKSSKCLQAAYNDVEGVTAQFNLNILTRLNSILDSDFDPALFSHLAFYNRERQRIEMHLVCRRSHRVQFNGHSINLFKGETLHTENSYKYTVEGFAALAGGAGFVLEQCWLDEDELFSVHYLKAT